MTKIAPIRLTLLVLAGVLRWSHRSDSWPDNEWNGLFRADRVAIVMIFAAAVLGVT